MVKIQRLDKTSGPGSLVSKLTAFFISHSLMRIQRRPPKNSSTLVFVIESRQPPSIKAVSVFCDEHQNYCLHRSLSSDCCFETFYCGYRLGFTEQACKYQEQDGVVQQSLVNQVEQRQAAVLHVIYIQGEIGYWIETSLEHVVPSNESSDDTVVL